MYNCFRSRVGRLKEGGVAGSEPVDISSVEDRLLAIYELAATKKKQKSVDKIRAALQDLFDCLKGKRRKKLVRLNHPPIRSSLDMYSTKYP